MSMSTTASKQQQAAAAQAAALLTATPSGNNGGHVAVGSRRQWHSRGKEQRTQTQPPSCVPVCICVSERITNTMKLARAGSQKISREPQHMQLKLFPACLQCQLANCTAKGWMRSTVSCPVSVASCIFLSVACCLLFCFKLT